jgi:predicted PurR-regulated permease PerM
MQSFNERFRQLAFFFFLLALGYLIFFQVKFLVPGFLGAVTLYVLNRKPFFILVYQKRWNKYVATTLLMAIDAIILLIPFGLATLFVVPKLHNFTDNAGDLFKGVKAIIEQITLSTGITILSKESLDNIPAMVSDYLPDFLSTAVNGFFNISTMFFLLFFMFIHAHKIESTFIKYIPLKPENKKLVTSETKNIVISYAIGIPVIAVAQGLCAYIGYKIFGISDPILWGFVTTVVSVIPFLGSGLIWVPLTVFLYIGGETQAAFGLAIYCAIVVLNIDNLLRLVLLKAFADIHPLITLFGVITGIKLFGFIGLIFGPLLVSYLLLLIRIYVNEFSENPEQVTYD